MAATTMSRWIWLAALLLPWFAVPSSGQSSAPPSKVADQAARRGNPGNLVGHGGPVKAIAVSPDGKRALTGSFDYSAIYWDLTVVPPKQIFRFDDHNGAVNAVAFVPHKDLALSAGDDSLVRLWDLRTGKLLHKFEGHDAGSKIVGLSAFEPSMVGQAPTRLAIGSWIVSSGWDRTARIWDLDTRKPGPVLRDHTGPVNAATVSSDGRTIYTASADGQIRAFDATSGQMQRRVHGADQGVNALRRLGPSDRLLFGTLSGQSGLLNGSTGAVVRMFPEALRPILALAAGALDTQAVVAIGSGDGRIRVFRDADGDGDLVQEYKSAFGPVWALAMRRTDTSGKDGGDATALYYGGLDDFATFWPFAPRAPFETVDASQYPRRFQQSVAAADTPLAKGELSFARKCSICHTLDADGKNRAGPTLHKIFGRRIATLPGYAYSPELKTLDIVWTAETIAKLFEFGPDKFTPGSKMPLQVMADKAERDALVTFLEAATK